MELQGEENVETLKQQEEPEPEIGQTLKQQQEEPEPGIGIDGGENDEEEEGIAEAVARWERSKQERLQSSQDQQIHQQQDTDDVAEKYGFIVEGCEFERYGRKAQNTSKWEWRIGRQADDDDEDEGIRQNNSTPAKPRTKQRRKEDDDDDDDWGGDGDLRKRPVPRNKNVQTRSKRQKVVVDAKTTTPSGVVAATSSSTKKASENEDDDLDEGFLVDDDDEETEVAEDEDEWTDDEDEEEEEEEEDEEEDPVDGDNRPLCKYGNNCFRKNKDHLAQFRH